MNPMDQFYVRTELGKRWLCEARQGRSITWRCLGRGLA